MPTPHAVGSTSNARTVFPLGAIARIVQSRFARSDRPMQFLFAFRKCVGHSAVIAIPGCGKTFWFPHDQVRGHQRQSTDRAGYNEVVFASSGSGMSLPLSTLVGHGLDFATNVDRARHRSILARTCDRPGPLTVIPGRGERSEWSTLDDAWHGASPENPFAMPISAFMAAAKPSSHRG